MRDGQSYQSGPRHKKKFLSNDEPRSTKVKLEEDSGSHVGKSTCATLWNKHYWECLLARGSFFECSKYGQKVRDVLVLLLEEDRVIKFLLMLQEEMLQRRIVSMHYGLEEQIRMMMMMMMVSSCLSLY